MDILPPLVADGQAPELAEPREGALHHPAVTAPPLAGLDALARDADHDMAPGQRLAAAGDDVGRVGMELRWALPGTTPRAPDGWDGVDEVLEDGAAMPIGAGEETRQWPAPSVGNTMALRAQFPTVRRVRAGGGSPFLAGTLALSRQARSPSI